MTVINKLNQTIEMLKSSESNCRTFSMDTDDKNAKQMFEQAANIIKQAEMMIQGRINYVIGQEPQYSPEAQQAQQMQSQQCPPKPKDKRIPDID